MNQNVKALPLFNYMDGGAREGWGAAAGARTLQKLKPVIDKLPDTGVVRISMSGTKRLDIAFASEALAGLISHCLPDRRVCLVDVTDADIVANLAAAAKQSGVLIPIWQSGQGRVLGLKPGSALDQALQFALARPSTRATEFAEFARADGVSISNASSRLKALWDQGALLRVEDKAVSGGKEFIYRPVS